MDSSEKKKADCGKIDKKAIIAMVGKSSRFNSTYENPEETATRTEHSPNRKNQRR